MHATATKKTSIKKFFYLSFFCLVPAFGIVVGIILSIYAIFRFKSIALFLTILFMTAGGMLLIKLDTVYLKNRMKYSKDVENSFTLLAANELDEIAQSLQKYKLKHGYFPDSLQQLEKEDVFLSIKDPLLARNPEAHRTLYFNYKKTEAGYILFSSGPDGIPNTKDDIYPRTHLK